MLPYVFIHPVKTGRPRLTVHVLQSFFTIQLPASDIKYSHCEAFFRQNINKYTTKLFKGGLHTRLRCLSYRIVMLIHSVVKNTGDFCSS